MNLFKSLAHRLTKIRTQLFRVGDVVQFTNDAGISWKGFEIIEILDEPMSYGGQFCLNSASPWYPTHPEKLRISKAKSPIRGLLIKILELFVPLRAHRIYYDELWPKEA